MLHLASSCLSVTTNLDLSGSRQGLRKLPFHLLPRAAAAALKTAALGLMSSSQAWSAFCTTWWWETVSAPGHLSGKLNPNLWTKWLLGPFPLCEILRRRLITRVQSCLQSVRLMLSFSALIFLAFTPFQDTTKWALPLIMLWVLMAFSCHGRKSRSLEWKGLGCNSQIFPLRVNWRYHNYFILPYNDCMSVLHSKCIKSI